MLKFLSPLLCTCIYIEYIYLFTTRISERERGWRLMWYTLKRSVEIIDTVCRSPVRFSIIRDRWVITNVCNKSFNNVKSLKLKIVDPL